jgi:hypothetical protein
MRGCWCLRDNAREPNRISVSHRSLAERCNSTQIWTNTITLYQSQVHPMAEPQGSLGNTKRQLQRVWYIPCSLSYLPASHSSRSHLQPALKSKSFSDRMENASKAQAIKKLQTELRDEKQAEIQRCGSFVFRSCIPLTVSMSILR